MSGQPKDTGRTWITRNAVSRILDVAVASVPEVVEAAKIRTRVLPGLKRIHYHREDVERLAASYSPA